MSGRLARLSPRRDGAGGCRPGRAGSRVGGFAEGEEESSRGAEDEEDGGGVEHVAQSGEGRADAAREEAEEAEDGGGAAGVPAHGFEGEGGGGGDNEAETGEEEEEGRLDEEDVGVGDKERGGEEAHGEESPDSGAEGAPGTAEARHEEAAGHDSEGVEAEAEAVEHGRQAVALLEDEGGGGDVGEHDAHGEGLDEGVAQELAVARDGKVRLEGGEEAWTAFARGGASGLAEAEEHEEEEDSEGEEDGEYAPPVGERQEEAAEDGSEDGGEALHDAEHGEVAGKAVALVEVDGDGAGDDDSARPGDALEEAVGEEEADVGGEKARGGGDEEEEEGGHEGRFAAEAVAERADEELPEAESHHAEGEAELDGGDGGGEVFAELRQGREVEVRDEGAERGKQSGEP